MKKIILLFVAFVFFQNVNAQCPSYAAAPSSATDACANQPLYFTIANTNCPGVTTFTVSGNSGSSFGSEITWEVVNVTTGLTVASGGPYTDGIQTAISVVVGPNDPNTEGTSYNLIVYDAFGDGFDADGGISIIGSVNPVSITGDFGTQTNSGFSVPIAVDDVNYTITTSAGTVTGVLTSCSDLSETLTFTNPSFCSTTTEDVTWSLSCASDGSILSSGTQTITVYPSLPTSAADLVSITWDEPTCSYIVTPTDCPVGSVFTISPDPTTLPGTPYTATGTETFTVTYTGPAGGPSCCATGGPAVPSTFVTPAPSTSAVATNSPFNAPSVAPANAAYVTTGPAGTGGTAVTGTFTVNVTGYSYPSPNFGGSPCAQGDDSYWVTIYVDGAVVDDSNYPAGDMNITIDLAAISAAGVTFDDQSVIEVYAYPNSFAGYDGCPAAGATATQTFYMGEGASPTAVGEWTASVDISAVLFEFTQLVPSPADCDFTVDVAYTACPVCAISAAVSNVVCSDNGTASDASDDTYTFDLTVTDDGGTGTTWSGNGQTGAAYGTPVAMGPFLITDGDVAISVAEDADGTCTATATATAPAACSTPTCAISAAVSNVVCSDNGTASDASDDTYTFDLTVTDDGGTGTTWSGNGQTGAAYGTPVAMGPFPISGGNTAISVAEDADATCTATATATAPSACSVAPGCSPNNGTPSITTP